MPIFQKSVINSIKQDESLVASRWNNFQNYIAKIDAIRGFKEEVYQDGFFKDIFESCLGYTLKTTNPNDYNLEREKKNETDGKKADGVIYVNGEIIGIVELKDQKTKNLDAVEGQAFNYHASHSNSKYIIISNFDELRFYIDKKTAYEKFNLFNLSYEDFRTLHLLISYESIKENIPLKLKEKSTNFEQTISKELYRDFSAFRTHLFENIIKNNDMDRSLLLRLTQKLCDRIIFILFAEDRELLKKETIKEIRTRHSADGFGDRSLYDYYKLYFNAINTGNDKLGIPKYNGGLFATDELLDTLIIDDSYLDMEAQKLSDFDFVSEISVNILGHIFEQSLTDLEEMNASINDTEFDKKKSKRKKDGVFYTPEYITRYIVENTLGKLCIDKKVELKIVAETVVVNPRKLTKAEQNYKETLIDYREWLAQLKILDPACGSGAFLNQALEFLIREHTLIRDLLLPYEDLMIGYEVEKSILEHNLYGVDINEDAVEIAKLSLWLRTAHKGRELVNLGAKIKCGNSLIADKNVAENAFAWEDEFPEVFAQGGFDVVIGNPPYVGEKGNKDIFRPIKEIWKTRYEKNSDLLYFFFMKSIDILKKNGNFGFITTNYFLTADSAVSLRKELKERISIYNLINFNEMKLFESALGQHNIITVFKKTTEILDTDIVNVISAENISTNELFINSDKVEVFSKKSNLLFDGAKNYIRVSNQANELKSVFDKIKNNSKTIDEICFVNTGFNSGADKVTESNLQESYKNDNIPSDIKIRDGIFVLTENEYRQIQPEKDLVFKCFKNSDIEKYFSTKWQNIYIIWTNKDTPIDNYPNIKKHLEKYRKFLELKREYQTGQLPWYSQHWAREYELFANTDKIILPYRSKSNIFSYSNDSYFGSKDILYIRQKDKKFNIKYLLALLNSKLYFNWLYYNGKRKGETLELYVTPVSQIPIKDISKDNQQPFIKLVDEILEVKSKIKEYEALLDKAIENDNFDREIKLKKEIEVSEARVVECEKEIDSMVYGLCELSEDEIGIVEGLNDRR